jgi:hypothetical protein
MRRVSVTLAAAATAAVLAAAPAQASWKVSVSGLWNTSAPVTAYSDPLETYSLSFVLPSQTFSTIYQTPDLSVTTQMSNVQFSLNGVAIPVTVWTGAQSDCSNLAVGTLCNVAFFDTALDGGLALAFSDHVLEFYGADIGSTGTLVRGDYSFIPNVDDTGIDEGTALATVVPEPASWAMLMAGAAMLGAAARLRRGRWANAEALA